MKDKFRSFKQYTLKELYETFDIEFPKTSKEISVDVKKRIIKFTELIKSGKLKKEEDE